MGMNNLILGADSPNFTNRDMEKNEENRVWGNKKKKGERLEISGQGKVDVLCKT